MAVIYLIRHAQASFGARDYDKLSEQGEQQAVLLGKALAARGVRPDLVVSGSMSRHLMTAQLALAAAGLEERAEVDVGFDEFDHEQVIFAHKPSYRRRAVMLADLARTGNPQRAFQEMFSAATERWMNEDDGYTETFQAFADRVESAVRRTAGSLGKGGTAVVFTSGGPISSMVSHNEHGHLDGTGMISYR